MATKFAPNFTNHFTLSMAVKTGGYRTIEVILGNDKDHISEVLLALADLKDYNEVKLLIDSGDGDLKYRNGKFTTTSKLSWEDRKPFIEDTMTDALNACSTGYSADFLFMGGEWYVTTTGTTKGFRPLENETPFYEALAKIFQPSLFKKS